MAFEAVLIELGPNGGCPVMRTVADGTSISKGTLCILSDPNTASASLAASTTGNPFAGIAAADKAANDGSTRLAFYTEGVFDLKTETDLPAAGYVLVMSGANLVRKAVAADLLTGAVVGTAEELASSGEVIRVRVLAGGH